MKKLLLALLLLASPLWAQDLQPPVGGDSPDWTRICAGCPPGKRFTNLSYNSQLREVIVIGGMKQTDGDWGEWQSDAWHFDTVDKEWYQGYWPPPPAKAPRAYSAAAYHPGWKGTFEFGGVNCWPCGGSHREAFIYDQSAGVPGQEYITWQNAPRAPCASERHSHAMVFDAARDHLVIFGGQFAQTGLGDTWILDDDWVTWKQQHIPGPTERYFHAMVYDSAREEVVLVGGTERPNLLEGRSPELVVDKPPLFYGREYIHYDDTWVYDGSSWTEQIVNNPPERYGAGIAYDYKRRVVVLFGGGCHTCDQRWRNDTWQWNGKKWTQMAPTKRPVRRIFPAMASSHDGAYLYGGYRGFTTFYADLWWFGN